MSKFVLLFVLSNMLGAAGQILLKLSANKRHACIWNEYFNKLVVSGYFLFLLSMFLMIVAYQGVEFKLAPVISSLSYFYILILGKIFLKTQITRNKIVGVCIIVLGIVVFNLHLPWIPF